MKRLCTIKPAKLVLLLVFAVAGFVFLQSVARETTVYVTNTGKKYHKDGCSALRRSKIAITPADAARSGYEPCGICKPPALPVLVDSDKEQAELYRVNIAELQTTAAADTGRMVRAEVVGHVDGDTIRVRIPNPPAGIGAVETIRMIGVDTPETVHPRQPVQRFGKEASNYTKSRLLNQNVLLAFDWDLRDRYGRLLAYIYTVGAAAGSANCFNADLIREGYGHAYTRFAFQFADEFRALEQDARRNKRGLWGEE